MNFFGLKTKVIFIIRIYIIHYSINVTNDKYRTEGESILLNIYIIIKKVMLYVKISIWN